MTIVEAKEKLKKEGYTSFNLEELNKNKFEQIKKYYMCNSEKNLQECFINLRADVDPQHIDIAHEYKIFNKNNYETYLEASTKKNEILKICNDNDKALKVSQMWYYLDTNSINLLQQKIYEDVDSNYLNDLIKNTYNEIVRYFFDFSEEQEFSHLTEFTYYDNGCQLQNHSDGTGTGRICAILIYLNEEYDENDGGILKLNNKEKVIPTFGRVAIIDLQTFDIQHMVTKVTGGLGRFAILTFVKKKEDEFINY